MAMLSRVLTSLAVVASLVPAVARADAPKTSDSDEGTEASLLGSQPIESGGYGAPVVKMGRALGVDATFGGVEGGWIVNHQFVLGGAAYGLGNRVKVQNDPKNRDLMVVYGGVQAAYMPELTRFIRGNVALLVGGGTIAPYSRDNNGNSDDAQKNQKEGTSFRVVEPELGADFNVSSFFRIGVGASYRFARGVDFAGVSDQDLSGLNGVVALKFGAF